MKTCANILGKKSLLLTLALLFSAGPGYASAGQASRVVVSSLKEVMSVLPPLPADKSLQRSVLKVSIMSLFVGPMIMLAVSEAHEPGLTFMGGVLTACGVVGCLANAAIGLANRGEASLLNGSIVIYDSDGNYKLGLVKEGGGKQLSRIKNSPLKIAAAEGVIRTIEAKQIKHVLDLNDYYANVLDEKVTLDDQQLSLEDAASIGNLLGATVVYRHNDKNYLNTVSGVTFTDDDKIEKLVLEGTAFNKTVLSVDSEGNPTLDGEPLQGAIFLP